MKHDEAFAKNLELTFEFDRYLVDHPKFAEKIPFDALVVLLPKYDRRLREYNLKTSKKNRQAGQSVIYVQIDGLKPPKSRLLRPQISTSANGASARIRKAIGS
jgi:hypothetical protein